MEIWDKERYDQSINELDDEEFFNLLSENIK
jgi:DNA-binding transcriptional regulator/RsmH inhibitor MraZ